jgi:hypothetical protein
VVAINVVQVVDLLVEQTDLQAGNPEKQQQGLNLE